VCKHASFGALGMTVQQVLCPQRTQPTANARAAAGSLLLPQVVLLTVHHVGTHRSPAAQALQRLCLPHPCPGALRVKLQRAPGCLQGGLFVDLPAFGNARSMTCLAAYHSTATHAKSPPAGLRGTRAASTLQPPCWRRRRAPARLTQPRPQSRTGPPASAGT